MNDIYEPPKSTVGSDERVDLVFSTLGVWRKIFLVLNWIFTSAFVFILILGLILGIDSGETIFDFMIVLFVACFMVGYAVWLHVSVSQRNITQLSILSFVQLVPFLNPIVFLILLAIRSTSKKEIA